MNRGVYGRSSARPRGMEEIECIVTRGSQQSVLFSAIPQIYRDLRMVCYGRSARGGTNFDFIRVRFNEDAGSNYEYVRTGRAITSGFGDGSASQTSMPVGAFPAGVSTANLAGMTENLIPGYASSSLFKVVTGTSTGGGAGDTYTQVHGAHWRNRAPITQVRVFLEVGPFVDGAQITLYGVGSYVGVAL